jgi:hypothetical protein
MKLTKEQIAEQMELLEIEAYTRGYTDGRASKGAQQAVKPVTVADTREDNHEDKHEPFYTGDDHRKDAVAYLKREVHNKILQLVPNKPNYLEFHVNADKGVVVALLRNRVSGKVVAKGKAKCMEGDTFNLHVGKYIALKKLLGESVGPTVHYLPEPSIDSLQVRDYVLRPYSMTPKPLRVTSVGEGKMYIVGGKKEGAALGVLSKGETGLRIVDDSARSISGYTREPDVVTHKHLGTTIVVTVQPNKKKG